MANENPPAQPAETGTGPGAKLPIRRVGDASTLRALSHPLRIQLLEALGMHGTMTATQIGEVVGESPTTCSFHLRQLARYGFVEEAGGGKGRARPWRITTHGLEITNTDDDPETEIVIDALVSLMRERQLDRYRTWRETRAAYPRRWRDAAEDADVVFHLTAEELKQLSEDMLALLRSRFPERNADPSLRPPGSVPVEMLVLAYPL